MVLIWALDTFEVPIVSLHSVVCFSHDIFFLSVFFLAALC